LQCGAQATVNYDHWIWHSFFGMKDPHNDINMLQRSLVFDRLVEGHAPPCNYEINGHQYTKGYYLADSIYPRWSTFVKTIPTFLGPARCYFATRHDSCMKNVKSEFGVLQYRFAISMYPDFTWSQE
jgi:hypothetical protein